MNLSNVVIPFKGKAQIEGAIAAVKDAGKRLDDAIQQVGMSVLAHVGQYGDVTVVTGLYNAMPNGSRKKALVEWLVAFGKLSVNPDKKTRKELPFLFDRTKETNLEAAAAKPWYECAKPADPLEVVDVQAMALALVNRITKAQSKGLEVKGAEHLLALQSIAGVAATVQ